MRASKGFHRMRYITPTRRRLKGTIGFAVLLLCCLLAAKLGIAEPGDTSHSLNIFRPESTPARSIFGLSLFVLAATGIVFVVVFSLLSYAVLRFKKRRGDDDRDPPQVYGSNQIETAWTVIPILIVLDWSFMEMFVARDLGLSTFHIG